jgi:DNA-binding GntR family transcriptional regulator
MDLLAAQAKLTAFVARGLAMREPSPEEEASMGARIARANEEFHSIIHQASGNTRLRNLILDLENSLPVSQIWRALRDANETEELNVRDHEDIAVALRDGDGPAAREAMSRHITRAGELLVEHLREVGFWKGKALR